MAKTLVENKICEACGADVRPGSLFCYNCGRAVAHEAIKAAEKSHPKTVKEALLEESVSERNDFKTTRLDHEIIEKAVDAPIPKPPVEEELKLRSAASLRRKPKTFKKIEVVWEEPDSAPNKWFPLVAVGLMLFVVMIFFLAMYLK